MKDPTSSMDTAFVDTPQGIFTASGVWFRTTEALLKEYADPVLEHESIGRLTAAAERWLRSPASLTLWAMPLLLWRLGIMPAFLITLGVYLLMSIWGPLFVGYWVQPLLKLLDRLSLQALYYIISMSVFAIVDRFELMAAGLAFFIVIRWGLLEKALEPVLKRVREALYPVPYPDQLLKSVIVRAAMKYHVALPELDRMERSIMNQLRRK